MTAIVDSRSALITLLKANADVIAQVGTKVFGDELPRTETDNMPQKCVVVTQSGGSEATWTGGDVPLNLQRYDVTCYGVTFTDADAVRRAVHSALKAIRRNVVSGVLFHWARPAGGALHGRDANADWPYKWNTWQVLSDERTAA